MSLELAIQANTAAIQQLIAVMSAGKFMSADSPQNEFMSAEGLKDVMTVGHVSGDGEPNLTASEMQTVATIAAVTAQVMPEEKPEPEVLEPAKPLTYEADVLPVLHKFLVAKGKPAAESLLKKYAVDKFSKVPAAQLGDLLADINEAMGVS